MSPTTDPALVPLRDVIAAVARGAAGAAARTGVTVRLIVTALRSHSAEVNRNLVWMTMQAALPTLVESLTALRYDPSRSAEK